MSARYAAILFQVATHHAAAETVQVPPDSPAGRQLLHFDEPSPFDSVNSSFLEAYGLIARFHSLEEAPPELVCNKESLPFLGCKRFSKICLCFGDFGASLPFMRSYLSWLSSIILLFVVDFTFLCMQ